MEMAWRLCGDGMETMWGQGGAGPDGWWELPALRDSPAGHLYITAALMRGYVMYTIAAVRGAVLFGVSLIDCCGGPDYCPRKA
jgi:hypothetical protein